MPIRRRSLSGKPLAVPVPEPEVRTARNGGIAVRNEAMSSVGDFGGIAPGEVTLARIKLIQGMSPELQNADQYPNVRNGEFFHTVSGDTLGKALTIIPVWKQKTYELWGDRDSNQGLLATADADGNWDKPHHKFEIPTRGGIVRADTKANVQASGLLNFGTSDPSNPKSKPLVAETFRLVIYLVDHPTLSPVLGIFSRMSALRIKELLTRIQMRAAQGEPVNEQVFDMRATLDRYGANQYFTPHFSNLSRLRDPDLAARIQGLARSMSAATRVKSSDEEDEGRPAPVSRRDYGGAAQTDY